MIRAHWHVHSVMPGYLCECDRHYPLSARERDSALRYERDAWRDYVYEGNTDDGYPAYIITGSIRSGRFDITGGVAFWRAVESWRCTERECLEDID